MLELKDFHFSLWLVVTAMYVLYENEVSKYPQQSPPPMGNRNRPIGPSNGSGRAHYPSGGRRHNTIWLRVYDPIFVVSIRTWVFYMKIRTKH